MQPSNFDASDFADFDSNDFGSEYKAPKPDKPERAGPDVPFDIDGVDA